MKNALIATVSCSVVPFVHFAAERPNILFIMSDDQGAHAMSCYGSKINSTPNMDAIARNGVRCNRVYATNPICAPSRACILTGMYSHKNGVPSFSKIPKDVKTIGGYMRDAGYYTAHIGKWHLGRPRSVRDSDWDKWMIYDGLGQYRNPYFFQRGADGKVERVDFKGAHETENLAKVCQKELDVALASGKPFFMMMHFKAPHAPCVPTEKNRERYWSLTLADLPPPETFLDDFAGRSSALPQTHCQMDDLGVQTLKIGEWYNAGHVFEFEGKKYYPKKNKKGLYKNDWPEDMPKGSRQRKYFNYLRFIQDYLACVRDIDDSIGEMMKYLKEKGVYGNTLVVYTSDQGFFMGDHGMWGKRYMFEQVMKMPFVAQLPGVIMPGTVAEEMCINEDFAPTFLDLAGAPRPPQMQGRSMMPVLKGETPADWRKVVYGRGYVEGGWKHTAAWNGVKTATDELIHYYKRGEWEYFDLATDRLEMKNRYSDPKCQKRIAELKEEIERQKKLFDDNDEFINATESDPYAIPLQPRTRRGSRPPAP